MTAAVRRNGNGVCAAPRWPDVTTPFGYDNRKDRPPGRLVTLAARLLPSVGRVQAQVVPHAAAWQRANLEALTQDGPLYVALGDSMSLGIGASAYDLGWVGQLAARLAEADRPHRVVNLAFYGARTVDVLDRQLPALAELGAVPELVTLLIGSNDVLSRRFRDGVAQRFEQILRRVPPTTVVATLPNPHRAAQEANAVIERVADVRGLRIAEMRQPRTTSWRGKLAADHFHPNEKGYAELAAVFAEAVL